MMRDNGFIKLDRKILTWRWYNDVNTLRVFLHLLLTANYSDGEYMTHPIKRGQVVTGRKKLSDQLKLTEREVRTALTHLKATNEVTIETTSKYSIITINNYDKYQQTTNKASLKRPASDQQTTNKAPQYKKVKKNKKNKKVISSTIAQAREIDTDDFDYCHIVDLYNSICVSLPKVSRVTAALKNKILEVCGSFENIDFESLFQRVEKSEFLTGKKTDWHGCNLNWILSVDNTEKILNGNYDDFKKRKEERRASYSLEDLEKKSLFND